MGPGGHSFHIKDRYSSMRSFQEIIKINFNLKAFKGFPNFPEKKTFNNKTERFLANRMTSLNNFFNNFLAIQEIAKSNNILLYFKDHALDQINKQKVEDMIEYLDKKAAGRAPPKSNPV